MNIKISLFVPKVKWGKKYINPNTNWYGSSLYKKKDIANIRKEIEEEFPKYKGKVCFFESVFEKTNL